MINRAVRLKRLVRLFRSTACTRNLAARKQANSLRKKENSQFMAPFYPIAAAMAREGGGRRRSSSLTGPVRVGLPEGVGYLGLGQGRRDGKKEDYCDGQIQEDLRFAHRFWVLRGAKLISQRPLSRPGPTSSG